ncbi:MAG: hypothetical protein MUC87_17600 [Bacteroidia bacterium]|nr:hypothetical protein [Bacteroidia bacterium]
MVKIGFIAEGASEKLILESASFQSFLQRINLQYVESVIDAEGNNNQLPDKRREFVLSLKDQGATHIFILTDKDQEPCITSVKERILPEEDEAVIVSVKQLEAWFLADSVAMKNYLNTDTYSCDFPESFDRPIDEIKRIRIEINKRGVADKLILTKQMILSGFSIENASAHPNCHSAKYFVAKLNALAS